MADENQEPPPPDWYRLRAARYSKVSPPIGWPVGVKPISQEGLALLGVDPSTNEIYWDGQKLVTERRWSNGERWLAGIAIAVTFIGSVAACVQAWAAWVSIPHP